MIQPTPRIMRLRGTDPPLSMSRFISVEEAARSTIPTATVWSNADRITVLATDDDGRLHVSISHPSRYPTWDEIVEVRAWAFEPEVEVVMVLARESEYVNDHPFAFHLLESKCGEEGA